MLDVGQLAVADGDIGNLHILLFRNILVDIVGERFVAHIDFGFEATIVLVIEPVISRFYEIVHRELVDPIGKFLLRGPEDVLGTGAIMVVKHVNVEVSAQNCWRTALVLVVSHVVDVVATRLNGMRIKVNSDVLSVVVPHQFHAHVSCVAACLFDCYVDVVAIALFRPENDFGV